MSAPKESEELDSDGDGIDVDGSIESPGSLLIADEDSDGVVAIGTLLAQSQTRSTVALSFRDGFCLPFRSVSFMLQTRLCVVVCPEFWIATALVAMTCLYGLGLTFYTIVIHVYKPNDLGAVHALRLNYVVFALILVFVLLYEICSAGHWQRLSLSTENVLLRGEMGSSVGRCGLPCCRFVALNGVVTAFEDIIVIGVSVFLAWVAGWIPAAFFVFFAFKMLMIGPFTLRVIALSKGGRCRILFRWLFRNLRPCLGFCCGCVVLQMIPFLAPFARIGGVIGATRVFVENIEER